MRNLNITCFLFRIIAFVTLFPSINWGKVSTFNHPILIPQNRLTVKFTGVFSECIDQKNNLIIPIHHLNTSFCALNTDTNKNSIIQKLQKFSTTHISEKAYLHFDKPYYAVGDTIYFKAYVTMGERHMLSTISNVLYVDFITPKNNIQKTLKLHLIGGIAWGDFALPDSLANGFYRVRAYTNWMRNDGDEAYFYKSIMVRSIAFHKISEITYPDSTSKQNSIQFFPEGGGIVNGLKTKVAFKAINNSGLGVNVSGSIVDNEGNEIIKFTSTHLGMGCFEFIPFLGKTYLARLYFSDGTKINYPLPLAQENGIAMSIKNDSIQKAAIKIESSNTFFQENKNKNFTLLIFSGGIATTVKLKLDSSVIKLDILKRKLFSGITRVTLFSPFGEPLSERLIFVQNYDQLGFEVNTEKTLYNKKEKVLMKFNVKNRAGNPVACHFSIAVTNESILPENEINQNTILTNLLLTSDLRGYIEQPNYYFTNINNQTNADLDLVMLTNGYRRFEWKKILNNQYPRVVYPPKSNIEIIGVAKNIFGKPVKNAVVSLIAKHDGQVLTTITDNNGQFSFSNLVFSDTTKFILQAVNKNGGNKIRLICNNDESDLTVNSTILSERDTLNRRMTTYLEYIKKQQSLNEKYPINKSQMLKTVNINGDRIVRDNIRNNLVSKQFADQVITPEQMAGGGSFSTRIQGVLHGVVIRMGTASIGSYPYLSNGTTKPMRVILDGVDTDGNLDAITGLDIENVEVLKSPGSAGAYGGFDLTNGVYKNGFEGVLLINSRIQTKETSQTGVLAISPKGFYIAREFYSPKYTPNNLNSTKPDLRSTIFWKPEVISDNDGNASIEYFNADGTGTYRVVIEGIDEKGNIGREVYRYKVE